MKVKKNGVKWKFLKKGQIKLERLFTFRINRNAPNISTSAVKFLIMYKKHSTSNKDVTKYTNNDNRFKII